MKRKILIIVYVFVCMIIIFSKECYGYLDPSAMTYMIQITATIVITISTSIGILLYKIKRKFKKNKEKKKELKKDLDENI